MYLPLSPRVLHGRITIFFFFLSSKKTILKSPFSILINFVWGTLHLCLLQRCALQLYVTHNQVYATFTATLHRMTCGCTNVHVTRQAKEVFLGNLQLEQISVYFHNPFQLLYELEKKSSLVTRALSAKSFTRETDSLHSCTRLCLVHEMVCLTHARFGQESTCTQT